MALTKISTDTIADSAITAAKIADGTVVAAEIAAAAIDGTKLADNAVTGAKIAMGSDAAGDILTHNGTDYIRLAKGTAAQVLKMNAGATAVEWGTDAGGIAIPGSSVAGDTLYHNGTIYTRLAKGTAGQLLTMNGGATAPSWADAAGGGGKVLAYIHHSTNVNVSIAGSWVNTGSTATLVTSAANSKIMCLYYINGIMKHTGSNTNTSHYVHLQKDSVDVQITSSYLGYNSGGTNTRFATLSNIYLSPTISSASTSVVFRTRAVNTTGGGNMSYQTNGDVSTMTLIELGA
jgi:hypothetical protein